MRTQPFLLAAALLFWGWNVGLIWAAVPLALAFELGRTLRFRWDFTLQDFQRIWNGCLILLLVSVLFSVGYSQSLAEGGGAAGAARGWNPSMPPATRWALLFFQWLPMVFSPFLAALIVSGKTSLPLSVFSWTARRLMTKSAPDKDSWPGREVTLEPLYLALVFASASTSNNRSPLFFLGMLALVGWSLWPRRSRRVPGAAWITLILLSGTLAFGLQLGLNQLQRVITNLDAAWFASFGRAKTDPLEARTSLGSLGQLKQIGRGHV